MRSPGRAPLIIEGPALRLLGSPGGPVARVRYDLRPRNVYRFGYCAHRDAAAGHGPRHGENSERRFPGAGRGRRAGARVSEPIAARQEACRIRRGRASVPGFRSGPVQAHVGRVAFGFSIRRHRRHQVKRSPSRTGEPRSVFVIRGRSCRVSRQLIVIAEISIAIGSVISRQFSPALTKFSQFGVMSIHRFLARFEKY